MGLGIIRIRDAVPDDALPLTDLLNVIIRIGGTTAFETPLTPEDFAGYFLHGPSFLVCFVAEDATTGEVLGFQSLTRNPDLPADWGDITTFSRREPPTRGVGTALFARTRIRAAELGLAAINTRIRADNPGGLAYYEKMGFRTYAVDWAVPLRDGTPVDRISKRYLVG
jgi:RimJ/RimL family protein N-acetyltransferase